MTTQFFSKVLEETIDSIAQTLGFKAMEYVRNEDAMHNFNVGEKMTGQIREKVIHGFALKHHISISDMRNDIEKGIIPSKEKVEEKFNDAINYLILEKASVLERIIEGNKKQIEMEQNSLDKIKMSFKDAPIGARFKFIGDDLKKHVYVKIHANDEGLVVKWEGNKQGHQSHCCWIDEANGYDFNTLIELQ